MAKVEFQLWAKFTGYSDYFTVIAHGTKKHCQEAYANYVEIPSIKELKIVRKEENKKVAAR